MTCPQRTLGGSASSIKVGQVGFGLMGMTWCDPSQATPDEQAFVTMKAAADSGSTLWNSGAFYGPQSDPYSNLRLLNRFFKAYPEYKDKVFLSVKGGLSISGYKEMGMGGLNPDASVDHLTQDLKGIKQALGDKEVNAYEMARVDPNTPIKEAMKNMLSLKEKGLFHHISLSEVGVETIKKANSVAPIAFVEIEYSPWERAAESLGVISTCEELDIPILAYSPIGKGMLTGTIKSRADIPEGDMRLGQDKFSEENFEGNLKLAKAFQQAAEKKGCTAAQLSLSWLIHQSGKRIVIPLPGSSKAERVKENVGSASIQLEDQELSEVQEILNTIKVHGKRYNAAARAHVPLWA